MSGLLAGIDAIEDQIRKGEPAPETNPTQLKLSEIQERPEVFQHRSGGTVNSDKHVNSLAQALRNQPGQPLAPLTVFWIGDAWCCIDGHHRLAAYRHSKIRGPVPVTVFTGTLEEAVRLALAGNTKDKLAMSRDEKLNGAWRLVIATGLSKSAISKATGVSDRTVGNMREVAKKYALENPGVPLDSVTWKDARGAPKGGEFDDDWMEQEATKLAGEMRRKLNPRAFDKPEIFLRALEICSPKLVAAITEFARPAPDEFDRDEGDEPFRSEPESTDF